ncbi:unnamed protein product [Lymnaea stagnalis]|uniref:THD domain-containing protein n=1 Tax=Lymnaea stagnalis TaxID=6523 RepID=A0AAV2IJJ7_LYMST
MILQNRTHSNEPLKSQRHPNQMVVGTPPSAHVFLHPRQHLLVTVLANLTDGQGAVSWHRKSIIHSDIEDDYEHLRGVHVSDDSLVLDHTGLYYVYSNIQLKPVSSNKTSGYRMRESLASKSWFHYVSRMSPNSPVNTGVLMRTVQTLSSDAQRGQESVFTGGIFHLQQGDMIYASFSEEMVVDFDNRSTFLGLFMITRGTKS